MPETTPFSSSPRNTKPPQHAVQRPLIFTSSSFPAWEPEGLTVNSNSWVHTTKAVVDGSLIAPLDTPERPRVGAEGDRHAGLGQPRQGGLRDLERATVRLGSPGRPRPRLPLGSLNVMTCAESTSDMRNGSSKKSGRSP